MIEVEALTKYYGPFAAVKGISFRAEKGEILGFLGPNAAGKTSTMRMLTGYMPATSGVARVAGFDVARDPLEVRRRVGYLPETVPLYSDMEVTPYLDFVAEVKGVPRSERRAQVTRVIEQCDLGNVARQRIQSVSKGYRQRVGLAQALLNNPEVLILDEPTIGLDPRQIQEIRHLIRSLGGERTVILSTHILPEVSMTCNRVIIINHGTLVAVDTPANLTAQLQKATRLELVAQAPARELEQKLRAMPGIVRVSLADRDLPGTADGGIAVAVAARATRASIECAPGADPRSAIAREVVNAGWDLLELRQVVMSLEEIFVKLVTQEDHATAESGVAA